MTKLKYNELTIFPVRYELEHLDEMSILLDKFGLKSCESGPCSSSISQLPTPVITLPIIAINTLFQKICVFFFRLES